MKSMDKGKPLEKKVVVLSITSHEPRKRAACVNSYLNRLDERMPEKPYECQYPGHPHLLTMSEIKRLRCFKRTKRGPCCYLRLYKGGYNPMGKS